jgi:clan AA aspartic protease
MKGRVDDDGKGLIQIVIPASSLAAELTIEAWIDTGFTGELVLPEALVIQLGLTPSGTIDAELGDGGEVELRTYTCRLNWFGQELQIEVIGSESDNALLGIGLLLERKLFIDFPAKTVSIE